MGTGWCAYRVRGPTNWHLPKAQGGHRRQAPNAAEYYQIARPTMT